VKVNTMRNINSRKLVNPLAVTAPALHAALSLAALTIAWRLGNEAAA